MSIDSRPLIVTHHSPDLDAIGAVWVLKRFDGQHFADAKVAFVNPGATITLEEAEEHGSQLHEVTHVDTGLGEFDHHQPERGEQYLSAALLVYQHVCKVHPELAEDQALKELVDFITETDQFGEVYWPDAAAPRYSLMLHQLVHGTQYLSWHNDDSQLHFGMECLDSAYATLTQHFSALTILQQDAQHFEVRGLPALAIETSNDEVIKIAQKQGHMLVIRKDPDLGHIRIKARPDAPFMLKALADRIKEIEPEASWYYHPGGKMLINGSIKHRNQKASSLSLAEVTKIVQEVLS